MSNSFDSHKDSSILKCFSILTRVLRFFESCDSVKAPQATEILSSLLHVFISVIPLPLNIKGPWINKLVEVISSSDAYRHQHEITVTGAEVSPPFSSFEATGFPPEILSKANAVRFEFKKGAADHTFMRIDGEPWKQPLPVDDDTVVVEISHFGQVSMLATPSCRSRSMSEPSSPITLYEEDEENDSTEEGESPIAWEERRKFGTADTFKFPDEIDISQLS